MADHRNPTPAAEQYIPSIPRQYWDDIRAFVESTVGACGGRTPYTDTDLSLAISRLALWCWNSAGLNLEPDTVFSRTVLDRFARVGLPDFNEAARGNIRSQLLRVAEVLLDPTRAPRRLTPMRAADPSRPYTEREVVALIGWAQHQSTPARRINAAVLLALGLGAGLAAAEIGNLRVHGISATTTGVDIDVPGARHRTVPVLREWEEPLRQRVATLDGDRFVFRENHTANYDNLISGFVGRSKSNGPVPQTQRMRATWIVGHLQRGVPVVSLLKVAGVESLDALGRYVRFLEAPPPEEEAALLRGDGDRLRL